MLLQGGGAFGWVPGGGGVVGGERWTTRGDLHQDSEDARLEGYIRRPADGAHFDPTRFLHTT